MQFQRFIFSAVSKYIFISSLLDTGLDAAELICHGNLKDECKNIKCRCISKREAVGDGLVKGNHLPCEISDTVSSWSNCEGSKAMFAAFIRTVYEH